MINSHPDVLTSANFLADNIELRNRSKPRYDFATLEKQKAHTEMQAFELYGAPGEIRTPDRLVRS